MPERKSQRVNLRAPSPQYANHDAATLPRPSAGGGNAVRAWVSFQTEHLAQPDTLLDPGIAAHSLFHSSFSLPPSLLRYTFPTSLVLASHRPHPIEQPQQQSQWYAIVPPPPGPLPSAPRIQNSHETFDFPVPFFFFATRKSDDMEEMANRSETM